MQYCLTTIVGDGTRDNPYRANVPEGFAHAAIIPTLANGTPRFSQALVLFQDGAAVPTGATLIDPVLAQAKLEQLDSKLPKLSRFIVT